jgi:hypothetical protein
MMTFDKEAKLIHCDEFDETAEVRHELLVIDGDWYKTIIGREDPNGGYVIEIQDIERPEQVRDVKVFFTLQNSNQLVAEPDTDASTFRTQP